LQKFAKPLYAATGRKNSEPVWTDKGGGGVSEPSSALLRWLSLTWTAVCHRITRSSQGSVNPDFRPLEETSGLPVQKTRPRGGRVAKLPKSHRSDSCAGKRVIQVLTSYLPYGGHKRSLSSDKTAKDTAKRSVGPLQVLVAIPERELEQHPTYSTEERESAKRLLAQEMSLGCLKFRTIASQTHRSTHLGGTKLVELLKKEYHILRLHQITKDLARLHPG
jgi:hypothetical protein